MDLKISQEIPDRRIAQAQSLQRRIQATSKSGSKENLGKSSNAELIRYFPGLYDGKVSAAEIHKQELTEAGTEFKQGKDRMQEVAQEFQSLFIKMMLSSMRKQLNAQNDMLGGGRAQEIFKDLLFDQYSMMLSKDDSFTLDEQIVKQMQQFQRETARNAYAENLP